MSQNNGNISKLFALAYRKLFSRYKIQLYASHNQEDFNNKILNLNAHYIDYKTNISGRDRPSLNSEADTLYEIYVRKLDYSHAELAMNTNAHR